MELINLSIFESEGCEDILSQKQLPHRQMKNVTSQKCVEAIYLFLIHGFCNRFAAHNFEYSSTKFKINEIYIQPKVLWTKLVIQLVQNEPQIILGLKNRFRLSHFLLQARNKYTYVLDNLFGSKKIY